MKLIITKHTISKIVYFETDDDFYAFSNPRVVVNDNRSLDYSVELSDAYKKEMESDGYFYIAQKYSEIVKRKSVPHRFASVRVDNVIDAIPDDGKRWHMVLPEGVKIFSLLIPTQVTKLSVLHLPSSLLSIDEKVLEKLADGIKSGNTNLKIFVPNNCSAYFMQLLPAWAHDRIEEVAPKFYNF